MPRILHASYSERGPKIGSIKICLDGQEVCALKNHSSSDLEITEGAHTVRCKVWGLIPVFSGEIPEGNTNWALSYSENAFFGKFSLYETKPFYGKDL